nr:type VI secretion protein IcmF [Legionella jordanis]
MDTSLNSLCGALNKILGYLKPQHNAISFIILTGKTHQGKSALLRQTKLNHYPLETEANAQFYYNQNGVILELGESWINQSDRLLDHSLKQLNRCHKTVRITGLMLCVDGSELLLTEPVQLIQHCKSHAQLLERFGQALGYTVDVAIVLSKLDALSGFCDFFQADHLTDLNKPLGFSLSTVVQRNKFLDYYRYKFDQMLEVLSQQTINKLHPARSTVKRTLIREFPLQLASLRVPIQSIIQNLSVQLFRIQAIYFTSAEQGGLTVDKLNKKIQHEYALSVQDKFPQSNNYRAYFIEGAIHAFQEQTKRFTAQTSITQKCLLGLGAGILSLSLIWVVKQHVKTSRLLDEASKELITYETFLGQANDKTSALYHLSRAVNRLQQIPNSILSVASVEQLKSQLYNNSKHRLQEDFLPELLSAVEHVILDPAQTQTARYQALKIYLMLGEPQHFSEAEVTHWFQDYWKANHQEHSMHKRLILLQHALRQPMQPIAINRQLVLDARNYLNALPATYLYYTLAKHNFPSSKQTINVQGFDLAAREIPAYFSKEGFKTVIASLPGIAAQLQRENWVLARQDLNELHAQLEQAYCFEYLTWWQNFVRRTKPLHYQDYQQGRQLTQELHRSNALSQLVNLIQKQTAPDPNENSALFNQKIANEFTNLNLLSGTAVNDLNQDVNELEKFLTTLSLVNDQGKTAFNLTKARFQGGSSSDALSTLYQKARQLPEPVASWVKQVADDTWFIFINESKQYINRQWQQIVFEEYQNSIANRYPLDASKNIEVSLNDFDHFFSPHGTLNGFVANYLKPFLDTSTPQWQPKEVNGYVMPISNDLTNELIRANVITNMFFTPDAEKSKIEFSLQKINLDPVVANLQLTLGKTTLTDNQSTESLTQFSWPVSDAKLRLDSIEGNHFELEETGPWAFFKMLQKVNVLVDSEDSASLQILFEVNGNSGRYLLKTQNQINPFSPGILTGFILKETVTG